ncbi:hypothetical protein [Bacillus sp. FJAT-45350]|uniref:hypothetical protein n=1 Tax=Bacillus sp. FJAT-45350 TaxID=2011014 RepID=UPI000BB7995B|nr:hypothetical protein [Bacillus sp. FJAT-45350]
MKQTKVKSVSFNLSDPYEKKLLEHASMFNVFSAYVKRLIQKDMEERKSNNTNNNMPKQVHRSERGGYKVEF